MLCKPNEPMKSAEISTGKHMTTVKLSDDSPIVVGGTGGSGTRALTEFLLQCGVEMGKTNSVGDALSFSMIIDGQIDQVMAVTGRIDYATSDLPPALLEKISKSYRTAGARHLAATAPGGKWGFKNPRQMFLLPVLELTFPSARFVHLVRDGRDMLLSENKAQIRKHFRGLFGFPFDRSLDHIAHFWAKTNLETHAFGTVKMGSRYVIARIEDLCGRDSSEHIAVLARRLGLDPTRAQRCAGIFRAQDSFGRGRMAVDRLSPPVREEFAIALAKFGYT